jgi:hypothetical protein
MMKWVGTGLIILAFVVRAAGYSNLLDLWLSTVGSFIWAVEAFKMQDKPLVTINGVATFIGLGGIIHAAIK